MSPCAPAGMYSRLPFALAQTSIELPYIVIQAVLFATITYWMMELETNPGTLLPPEAGASKAGLRCASACTQMSIVDCEQRSSAALLHV